MFFGIIKLYALLVLGLAFVPTVNTPKLTTTPTLKKTLNAPKFIFFLKNFCVAFTYPWLQCLSYSVERHIVERNLSLFLLIDTMTDDRSRLTTFIPADSEEKPSFFLSRIFSWRKKPEIHHGYIDNLVESKGLLLVLLCYTTMPVYLNNINSHHRHKINAKRT